MISVVTTRVRMVPKAFYFNSGFAVLQGPDLTTACRWLATLLVAWGLLETKQGHQGRAKVLAARAACLDGSKGKAGE